MLASRLSKYEVRSLLKYRMKMDVVLTISNLKRIKDLEELHMKYKDFINVVLKVVRNHMVHRVV
jgi:hypothetical protein